MPAFHTFAFLLLHGIGTSIIPRSHAASTNFLYCKCSVVDYTVLVSAGNED